MQSPPAVHWYVPGGQCGGGVGSAATAVLVVDTMGDVRGWVGKEAREEREKRYQETVKFCIMKISLQMEMKMMMMMI